MSREGMTPADDTPDQVGALIRSKAAEVSAPDSLRVHVEALREARRPRTGLWPRLALGGAAAAALALMLVFVLAGSTTHGPSLADAAAAALRPAVGAPPAADPQSPAELDAHIGGIEFPRWEGAFGLRAAGQRTDRLGDRRALTVVYAGAGGSRVGYTIVDTPPLDVPASARRVTRRGTRLAVFRRDGATVVTWRRDGHTCVLASRTLGAPRLLALAAWTGRGELHGYER